MSEHEFETYLALLGKLLRLSDEQRDAIADELRDHMEQRLDELARRGVAHDEAVRIALAEFGDAAGLAGQFTRITHRRTVRRIIMNTSIGTIAAAAVIVLAVSYLMPVDRVAVPSNPTALADDDASSASSDPSVADRLSKPVDLELTESTLADGIELLREVSGLNIFVNWRTLEREDGFGGGVFPDSPISMNLRQVPIKTALSLVLDAAGDGLGYAIRDNVVVISTRDNLVGELQMRFYDCSELIQSADARAVIPELGQGYDYPGTYGSGGGRGYGGAVQGTPLTSGQQRANELVALINNTMLDTGMVSIFDGIVVVQTTPEGHERIDRMLHRLREYIIYRSERRKAQQDEATRD